MPYREVYAGSSANEEIAWAWMFLEIDFLNGKITFHRPKLVPGLSNSPHTEDMANKQISDELTQDQRVFARLLTTLDAKRTVIGDESCAQFIRQRTDPNCWTFDARNSRPLQPTWASPAAPAAQSSTWGKCNALNDFGVAVLFDMELMYASMTVALWDASDINSYLRPNLSYWLLKGELPMF